MIHVTTFRSADLHAMKIQPSQDMDFAVRERIARQFEQAGRAFTAIGEDGRVIFCGGAVELHEGHAQLWAVFAEGKRQAMFRLRRATRDFIASLPHRRVDTPVLDNEPARRWAEAIGLIEDVRLADAAPGGGDLILYRRVN